MQESEDLRLYSEISYKLARWVNHEPNRVKASKIYKMIFKYERLWLKHHESTYSNLKWITINAFKK